MQIKAIIAKIGTVDEVMLRCVACSHCMATPKHSCYGLYMQIEAIVATQRDRGRRSDVTLQFVSMPMPCLLRLF